MQIFKSPMWILRLHEVILSLISGSDHFEPHALYNSASTASGRLSSMSQNSEGGVASTSHCSDDAENWDSWDDEDVESPNSDRVYGEFLQKLHSTLVSQGQYG